MALNPSDGYLTFSDSGIDWWTIDWPTLAPLTFTGEPLTLNFAAPLAPPKISTLKATPTFELREMMGEPRTSYMDSAGAIWKHDSGRYTNGNIARMGINVPIATIKNTPDEILFRGERWSLTRILVPNLPTGRYRIRLLFCEFFWDRAGQRVFHIDIQGMRVASNVDIVAAVGKNAALTLTFDATVLNEQLLMEFTAVQDGAKISAFEVVSLF